MMKASVGDHIVIVSPTVDGTVRDGEVLEVRNPDGTPPYLVRWSDTKSTALIFPGVDARVARHVGAETPSPTVREHTKSWRITIDLFEAGDDTTAHAVLLAESPVHIDARGRAHRSAADVAAPEIGDEVAVARALRGLADRLLDTASEDITAAQGRPTHLQH
jgi:hypothetical protein